MTWKGTSLVLDTPFPIMVVTSESMEPAFQVGDVLLVANHQNRVGIGDLPVCWLPERQFPMIHRVIQTVSDLENRSVRYDRIRDRRLIVPRRQLILTKGDNNVIDDALLYPEGQDYLSRQEVVGFVRLYVPFVGWPVILAQNPGRWRDLVSRLWWAPELVEDSNVFESFSIEL